MSVNSFADDDWIGQFDRGERRDNKPTWLNLLFGKGEKTQQLPLLTPHQQALQQQQVQGSSQQMPQMLQYIQQILSGDQDLMDQFQAPSRRSFKEQTIPTIMERFSGMGAQESSGFQQSIAGAGQRHEEGLAAQQANLKGQGINQLLQMMSQAQERSFENLYSPATEGIAGPLAEGGGQAASMAALMKIAAMMAV